MFFDAGRLWWVGEPHKLVSGLGSIPPPATTQCPRRPRSSWSGHRAAFIPESSNGRRAASEADNRGSSPRSGSTRARKRFAQTKVPLLPVSTLA